MSEDKCCVACDRVIDVLHKDVADRCADHEERGSLYQEALAFCDGPAGMAPGPDCEKAIEIIRKLIEHREKE